MKKAQDLKEIANGGGNDADLLLYEKIDEVNTRVVTLEKKVSEDVAEDTTTQKMISDMAKSFMEIKKGEVGEGGLKGDTGEIGPMGLQGPKGDKGDKGEPGEKGEQGNPGLKGEDGKDGTDGSDGVSGSLDTPVEVRDKLESLLEDERLDISAIKGMDKTLADIKASGKNVTIAGGSGRGIQLYVNSVKKGLAQYIDIEAGPNMTISDSIVNGLHTITFTSTGGSGFTTLTATETPNGSITAFTFSGALAQPSFLIVDNVWMKATTASGTVNWTWNAGLTQATLSIPAQDDILAVV